MGQPWVHVGSTLGQPSVMSLPISARFSLILLDSQMKVRDRRHFFHEIVEFPIGKRHFRVRGWSGAFWEPLERKKDKTKCIYTIYNPLHRSDLEISAKNHPTFWWNEQISFHFIPFFLMNLAIFRRMFHQILPEFHGSALKMADILKCW